ncbi:MAG: DUF2304 domain-containing protein [Solirubrobacterales bacterium]
MISLFAQAPNQNVDLPGNVQVIAVVVTVLLLGLVLELVRRRRLVERYALIWIIASIALVALAVWRQGLAVIGDLVGVASPVNAIFLVAFGVVYGLLLNFSVAISRLSEETKILAQLIPRLDAELLPLQRERAARNNGDPVAKAGSEARTSTEPTQDD